LPNIKSSKKDVIRSRKLRLRNLNVRSRAKTLIRAARVTIDGRDAAAAAESVKAANKLLDKAAAKGIIHKRQAARRKSRLARRLAQKGATA
jgi:small subunit ribosomal protein S20